MKRCDIQFCGLPASGKTTVINSMVDAEPNKYRRGKIYVFKKIDLLEFPRQLVETVFDSYFIYYSFVNYIYMFKSGLGIRFSIENQVSCLYNIINYKIDKKKCKDDDRIVLWDEFLLQRVYSLAGYSFSSSPPFGVENLLRFSRSRMKSVCLQPRDIGGYYARLKKRGLTERMRHFGNGDLEKIINSHLRFNSAFVSNESKVFHTCESNINIYQKIGSHISHIVST